MTKLKIYGENAFTFLFFDNLVRRNGIPELLGNLKRFDKPREKFSAANLGPDAEGEVWLFPSFGKRVGFGEPDAIIMIGRYAFWIEVESDVDLRSAEQPLRQLARFHCAAQAFRRGPVRQENRLVYAGVTISERDEKKHARLRLRGHQASPLLQALQVADAHHYVLYSVHPPRGDGNWRTNLPREAATLFTRWDRIVGFVDLSTRFPLDHAWYVYWERDLKRFAQGEDPVASYVPIKRA